MKSKVLITGASGFVGSHLVEEALKNDLDVYAGIRKSSSQEWLQDERIQFLYLDLSDQSSLEEVMEKHHFDYVIHNAGVTKTNKKSDYFRVNVDFSKNLALASLKSKRLKKFAFMSSLAAYGPADFQEDKVLSNRSKPHPVTTYGKSKLRAEGVLKEIKNLPLLIFRPTGIFGPRESDFLTVFQTIQKGVSPSVGFTEQWISLVYVKDLVRVLIKACSSDVNNQAYFVTDGNLYKTSQFNEVIAESLGKKPLKIKVPLPFVFALASINEGISRITGKASILNMDKFAEIKSRNLDCDISNLVQDFEYRPDYTLEAAVSETADWYKAQNWL